MTLEQRYAAWRQAPESEEILIEIQRRARLAADRGVRFGVKFFAELVRWEKMQLGQRTEQYKVNNSYVSRIARELAELNPSLKPFFEIRKLASEREVKVDKSWLKLVNSPRRIPTVNRRRQIAA